MYIHFKKVLEYKKSCRYDTCTPYTVIIVEMLEYVPKLYKSVSQDLTHRLIDTYHLFQPNRLSNKIELRYQIAFYLIILSARSTECKKLTNYVYMIKFLLIFDPFHI